MEDTQKNIISNQSLYFTVHATEMKVNFTLKEQFRSNCYFLKYFLFKIY